MKEMASWRSARVASLIPNVLPRATAAACIAPIAGQCWCQTEGGDLANIWGDIFCYTCDGRVALHCVGCCTPRAAE
jgi:hypothetical protein